MNSDFHYHTKHQLEIFALYWSNGEIFALHPLKVAGFTGKMTTYDTIDLKIMRELSADGRISISDLSETIGLSQTPTAKRVKRLEECGLIKEYRAILDETRLGGALTVFTWVSLVDQTTESLASFETLMKTSPSVMGFYLMTGDADYLVRIAVDNLAEFEAFLTNRMSKSKVVSSIRSSFALRAVDLDRQPPALKRSL